MATTTLAPSVSPVPRRRVDVHAIVSELLRHEEADEELAVEESTFRRMIETRGMLGCDPELGAFD